MFTLRIVSQYLSALCLVVIFELMARIAKRVRKPIDIGLGPGSLVNYIHHKKALSQHGYSAETFVFGGSHITDEFDLVAEYRWPRLPRAAHGLLLFVRCLFAYRAIYLSFGGGPLAVWPLLHRFEPRWMAVAGVRTVVLPYGGDIQVMTRNANLLFRHATSLDNPRIRRTRSEVSHRVDLWSRKADFVLAGVDWVEYIPGWDLLVSGHFSIDAERWTPAAQPAQEGAARDSLTLLHAPNHRNIKGSQFIIDAVRELQQEGIPLQLKILERIPNSQLREAILAADVVVDQLVIGWYALFAIEAMACGKPVVCNLDERYLDLHRFAGTFRGQEIPMINARYDTIKDVLRDLWEHRERLPEIGKRSREFVEQFHSTQAIGEIFHRINAGLGIAPSGASDVASQGPA